ncbi:MAG: insulinase family protein [Nitrospirae bacterium]|nr:insulinase family protein [Nitrospirota bacterium]
MRKFIPAFLLLILIIPSLCFAGVREYKIPNGIKVLMVEDHKAPIAVFQIWYRVGSRNESSGKTGLSHLLEHMAFKGTPRYGSKTLSQMVQRFGGIDNAFTSKDYTVYFQRLPSNKIDLSIELESDRMQNLLLEENETLAELSVVMEERRLRYEDDPQSMLYEEVVSTAFRTHPYRTPIIGWMSDLEIIERQDLYDYYKNYYSPDNAVIIISGDINPDEMFKKVSERFSNIMPKPQRKINISKEPSQKGQRIVYLKKQAELPYILTAYHTPSFPDEDAYSLEVLAGVLSEGKSSRLYKSLVYEKKLALSTGASYSGINKDPFLFFLETVALPNRDIEEVKQALFKEIEEIKLKPPTDFEVQKAKNQIESQFIMGQDSIFFQAQLIGMFEMAGDWRLMDKYIEGIRKVTPEDLQRVTKKYLHEDNRTVGILIPEEK